MIQKNAKNKPVKKNIQNQKDGVYFTSSIRSQPSARFRADTLMIHRAQCCLDPTLRSPHRKAMNLPRIILKQALAPFAMPLIGGLSDGVAGGLVGWDFNYSTP